MPRPRARHRIRFELTLTHLRTWVRGIRIESGLMRTRYKCGRDQSGFNPRSGLQIFRMTSGVTAASSHHTPSSADRPLHVHMQIPIADPLASVTHAVPIQLHY